MKLTITSAAISALLLAGTAVAQGTYTELEDDVQVSEFSMTVDDLDDMEVHNSAGDEIGEVEEVLGMDDQTATALAVDFNDDVAENDRVVQLTDLSMDGDRLVVGLDNDAISQLEEFDD